MPTNSPPLISKIRLTPPRSALVDNPTFQRDEIESKDGPTRKLLFYFCLPTSHRLATQIPSLHDSISTSGPADRVAFICLPDVVYFDEGPSLRRLAVSLGHVRSLYMDVAQCTRWQPCMALLNMSASPFSHRVDARTISTPHSLKS